MRESYQGEIKEIEQLEEDNKLLTICLRDERETTATLKAENRKLEAKVKWFKIRHAKALRRQFDLENASEPMVNRLDDLEAEIKIQQGAIAEQLKYRREDQVEIKTLENVIQNKSAENKKLREALEEISKYIYYSDYLNETMLSKVEVIIKQALKDGE